MTQAKEIKTIAGTSPGSRFAVFAVSAKAIYAFRAFIEPFSPGRVFYRMRCEANPEAKQPEDNIKDFLYKAHVGLPWSGKGDHHLSVAGFMDLKNVGILVLQEAIAEHDLAGKLYDAFKQQLGPTVEFIMTRGEFEQRFQDDIAAFIKEYGHMDENKSEEEDDDDETGGDTLH